MFSAELIFKKTLLPNINARLKSFLYSLGNSTLYICFQNAKMTDYFLDTEYDGIVYPKEGLNHKDFERCTFSNCDFSQCTFVAITFIDCVFEECNFNSAKINYVAFRTAAFNGCQIKDVNFAMCDKLIFDISFNNCTLDFSKFFALKLKNTILQIVALSPLTL